MSVAELSKREQNVIEVVIRREKNDNILKYQKISFTRKIFQKNMLFILESLGLTSNNYFLRTVQLKNLLMLYFYSILHRFF